MNKYYLEQLRNLPPFTSSQEDIIFGSLLGDGCLHKAEKKNSQFTKRQKLDNKSYLDWHYQQLKPYSLGVRIEHIKGGRLLRGKSLKDTDSCVFYTSNHSNFTEMRKLWYPNGKKIVPKNDWNLTPLMLSIWYCDDGTNHRSARSIILYTNSFSNEDCEFLIFKLFNIGLVARLNKSRNQNVLVLTGDYYEKFINLVSPYIIWECFLHKTHKRLKLSQGPIKILSAFGEEKRLIDWSKDDRCKCSYFALKHRIRNNWNAEQAMITLSRSKHESS